MRRMPCISILTATWFLLTASAFARPGIDDRSNHNFHKDDKTYAFKASGILQCADQSHEHGEACQLKFIRLSDKKEFRIEQNDQLTDIHCNDHRDVEVTLSGKYTVRAIFGTDRIQVDSFEKVKKLDSNEVQELLSSLERHDEDRDKPQLPFDTRI